MDEFAIKDLIFCLFCFFQIVQIFVSCMISMIMIVIKQNMNNKTNKQENTNKLSNNTSVYNSFMFFLSICFRSNRSKQKPTGNHIHVFCCKLVSYFKKFKKKSYLVIKANSCILIYDKT